MDDRQKKQKEQPPYKKNEDGNDQAQTGRKGGESQGEEDMTEDMPGRPQRSQDADKKDGEY